MKNKKQLTLELKNGKLGLNIKHKNLTFHEVPFTAAAGNYAMEMIAEQKPKDRKYLQQALVSEFESIESKDHQYMTLADVLRVLKTLKIKH